MVKKPLEARIEDNRAALFDWITFGASFCMGFMFPSLYEFAKSPDFPYWMLFTALLYGTGAWLKHRPLCHRLMLQNKDAASVPFFLFLLIGHFIIFLVVLIASIPAWREILGLPKLTHESSDGSLTLFLSMVGALLISWFVFRPKKRLKNAAAHTGVYFFRREMVADILLMVSVSVLSFAFWEKGVMAMLISRPTANAGDIWFLFIFLSICYIFFYLPLRYLFLVEDHSRKGTWKRLLFIFGLLLLRSLFELLRL